MRSLAIIPARGGSKRIPGKNREKIGGQSLVERAVRSAAPCSAIVVSTDDLDMCLWSSVPIKFHARKPEHATDTAQLEPVIDDVLAQYGEGVEAVVLLQPTSPFRTAAHVAEALRILGETKCDSVVSVTRLHSLHREFNGHIGNTWNDCDGEVVCPPGTYHRGGGLRMMRPPSSSLQHLVYENGAIYAFTRGFWERGVASPFRPVAEQRMGGDMRALVMHWSEAVEIDTPEDLEAARRMASPWGLATAPAIFPDGSHG